eukprot:2301875-Alexandrium_andersonii.AAC.1
MSASGAGLEVICSPLCSNISGREWSRSRTLSVRSPRCGELGSSRGCNEERALDLPTYSQHVAAARAGGASRGAGDPSNFLTEGPVGGRGKRI